MSLSLHWFLVGGLEHFLTFPYIGNHHPNWLSYFSEGWLNHHPDFECGTVSYQSPLLKLNTCGLVTCFYVQRASRPVQITTTALPKKNPSMGRGTANPSGIQAYRMCFCWPVLFWSSGWLWNPESPKRWLKHVETLEWRRIPQPATVVFVYMTSPLHLDERIYICIYIYIYILIYIYICMRLCIRWARVPHHRENNTRWFIENEARYEM